MADLKVEPAEGWPGQYWINGGTAGAPNYFSVHGFFGDHGPHVFASAPELLEALKAMVLNDQHAYRDCHKAALAAIDKAEGRA